MNSQQWVPAGFPPPSREIVIGLARLAESHPGCEHPMIVQYTDDDGWKMVCYLDQTPLPIVVLGWMVRPEFMLARHELNRAREEVEYELKRRKLLSKTEERSDEVDAEQYKRCLTLIKRLVQKLQSASRDTHYGIHDGDYYVPYGEKPADWQTEPCGCALCSGLKLLAENEVANDT